MKNFYKNIFYFSGAILLTFLSISPAFCEDSKPIPPDAQKEAVTAPKEVKELSIYGEVKAVNKDISSISVQYYDYDTDEEKTADININKDTKLENASNASAIKQGDWVDATYSVVDGKNIAGSVIVEKEEVEDAGGESLPPAGANKDTENE